MDDVVTGEKAASEQNLSALVTARTEQLTNAIAALEKSFDLTLEALGNALALRDPEGGRHSKRVTAFSIAIARGTGMSGDEIRVVARCAFLHDIGKLAVPEAILHKREALTPQELNVMRSHCENGYRIVKKMPFLAEPAEIVYAHHENYDGTGYPRGVSAQAIPRGARIVSVANAFDSMTSDQPHRKSKTVAEAKEELDRCAGSQFDPEIVKAFLEIPENRWSELRKASGAEVA